MIGGGFALICCGLGGVADDAGGVRSLAIQPNPSGASTRSRLKSRAIPSPELAKSRAGRHFHRLRTEGERQRGVRLAAVDAVNAFALGEELSG